MRRWVGLVLLGFGVAFLVLAPMLKFHATPRLAVAPLDLDVEDVSASSGTALKLFDPATLTEKTNIPLTSDRYTTGDAPASAQAGGNVGVYDSFSRVNEADTGRLVTASVQRYAFDRTSSVLTTGSGSNIDGEPITADEIAGDAMMPLKFPFFVDTGATYNYFDTTLRKGAPVTFTGEEEIDGLQVYRFEGTIEPVQIGEQAGLASLIGAEDPEFVAPRYYSNHRTLLVDPYTGKIVKGTEDQLQTFRGPDGTDAVTVLQAEIGFTDATVATNVEQTKTNAGKLKLISQTLPLLLLVLGLVLLAVGVVLLYLAGRDRDQTPGPAVAYETVDA
jgi:Porin PorA